MRMKTMLAALVLVAICSGLANALTVTEIMYNPDQADDADAEWIELYNENEFEEDLSKWQLNGKQLSGIIYPESYIVVARELIDGTDTDSDSFESIWGNNNGIWDESFDAISVSISLPNSNGIVNLSNGTFSQLVAYASSLGGNGNGKSLNWLNSSKSWNESSSMGGTPGFPNEESGEEGIPIRFAIANAEPSVSSRLLEDDISGGIPDIIVSDERTIRFIVEACDSNGAEDIANISAEFAFAGINLAVTGSNETCIFAEGNLTLARKMQSGNYSITAFAEDNEFKSSSTAEFRVLGYSALVVKTGRLDFGTIEPGKISKEQSIEVINMGTGSLSLEFALSDKKAEKQMEALIGNEWIPLDLAEIEIMPEEELEILLRITVPRGRKASVSWRLFVNARQI